MPAQGAVFLLILLAVMAVYFGLQVIVIEFVIAQPGVQIEAFWAGVGSSFLEAFALFLRLGPADKMRPAKAVFSLRNVHPLRTKISRRIRHRLKTE
jgi:hypothetical protein